jgi:hypothetical protein
VDQHQFFDQLGAVGPFAGLLEMLERARLELDIVELLEWGLTVVQGIRRERRANEDPASVVLGDHDLAVSREFRRRNGIVGRQGRAYADNARDYGTDDDRWE